MVHKKNKKQIDPLEYGFIDLHDLYFLIKM